jgi:lysophospholipase L1-like esterase
MINKACAAAISVGATFIPCTIPSVPNITHKGKNNYIKTNFSRYIDFDDALTDGSDWIDGYLSSDKVHPTADGFFAMATEAIKDVPEFFDL